MHFILLLPIQVLFFLQRYNIFIYPPNFSPNINDFFSIRLQTSSLESVTCLLHPHGHEGTLPNWEGALIHIAMQAVSRIATVV